MKKRIIALVLCMLMVIGLVGCGKSTDNKGTADSASSTKTETKTETKSEAKADDSSADVADEGSKYQTTYGSKMFDNVTITVELFDRSNAPEGSTITDNKWTNYVNEQMNKVGINVEFVPVGRWDEVTKMQAMMASGTAPDLTLTYTYAYAEDYYNQGGVWKLNDFIGGADQAQNMKAYLGSDVLDIGRNPDGDYYGIVAKRATTAKSNLFYRKDWLDKLGLAVPTTVDELYNVVEQFVKNNPDGRTDTVGLWQQQAWNTKAAFSQVVQDPIENAIASTEDVVRDYYDKGLYDYYKFLNKCYNNGYMDEEYYTRSEDDFKTMTVTGRIGFYEYSVNGNVDVLRGSLLKTLQENVQGADVISGEPLKNVVDGKQYSAAYAAGGLIAFCPLTASEEKVEACMTYLDWMCSQDGGFVLYHGFEGEHYDMVDGIPVVKDAAYNSADKDWIRTDIFLTGNQGYFATVDDFNKCTSKEAPGYEDHVIANYENALIGTIFNDTTYTSPTTPELITDLNLIKDDCVVNLITGTPEQFDANYQDYMDQLEAAGIQTIIDERTSYYKGN